MKDAHAPCLISFTVCTPFLCFKLLLLLPTLKRSTLQLVLSSPRHATPPYVPEVQPIELVWATVKQLVARQSISNRSVEAAQQQTEAAFDTLSAASCLARIEHCERFISSWLQTPAADELQQYKDLADLIKRLPDSEMQKVAESAAELEPVELDVE